MNLPSIAEATVTDRALATLASDANAAHAACEGAIRSGLVHAYDAGEALFEAKEALPHGQFSSWIEAHCKFSQRTAQRYVRVYCGWDELLSKDRRKRGDLFPEWLEYPKATSASFSYLERYSVSEAMRILSGKEDTTFRKRGREPNDREAPNKCAECGSPMITTPSKYLICEQGCGRLIGTMAKPNQQRDRLNALQLVNLFFDLDHPAKLDFLNRLTGKCEPKMQLMINKLIEDEKASTD